NAGFPEIARLDREITALTRQVAADSRSREVEQRSRASRPVRRPGDHHAPYLAPAFPIELGRRPVRARPAPTRDAALEDLRVAERSRRQAQDQARERDRRDAPGIGW
ncbi:MAG TPA: hypothetical protein VGL04_08270, partial [Sporichthyaceae bacterium]